ncbi:MAG: hypothetical protein JWN52_1785 [Actinomycetia bacterium]|nr:hypothetical protein [Actinomycetes bacterium]
MHPNNPNPGPYGPVPPQVHYQPPRSKGTGAGKGCLIAIGVAVGLFVVLGACGVLLSASSTGTTPNTAASPSSPAKAAQPANPTQPTKKSAPVNGIGREYRDGKFAFTVTKIKKGVHRVGDQYIGQTAQGQFVLVYVTVRNIGNEARTFDSSSQKLTDAQGRDFDADSGATIAMGDQSNAFLKDINPGNGVKGILIFDVPAGVKLKSLELHDSPFSGGVTISLPG